MELGQRIKEKRKAERLSAESLALKLGLKKDNIYKWERGSKPSDPEEWQILMNWLENVPHENGIDSKNAPVKPLEAQHGHNYTNEYIQALEELNQVRRQREKDKANLEKQLLDYAQAHQNLLELVIHELDLVRAKLEKRKPTDIQIERNNKAKRLLGTQKKEGT